MLTEPHPAPLDTRLASRLWAARLAGLLGIGSHRPQGAVQVPREAQLHLPVRPGSLSGGPLPSPPSLRVHGLSGSPFSINSPAPSPPSLPAHPAVPRTTRRSRPRPAGPPHRLGACMGLFPSWTFLSATNMQETASNGNKKTSSLIS